MSEHARGDESARGVDRRHFMLGATNVFGAAALAGWLARPDGAEGSTAPGEGLAEAGPRRLSTSQFVIHQDAPTITPVDGPGQIHGDGFYFHADLRLNVGGAVVGPVVRSQDRGQGGYGRSARGGATNHPALLHLQRPTASDRRGGGSGLPREWGRVRS
jgi:hypothetical protein